MSDVAKNEYPQLRTFMVWPEIRLPPHPIVVTQTWREGNRICYPPGWDPEHFKTLPEEWVLRELPKLDLEDWDVVTNTVSAFGVIDGSLDFMQPLLPIRPPTGDIEFVSIWVTDVVDHLRTARAVLNHWLAFMADEDPTAAWENEGFPIHEAATAEDAFITALNHGLRAFAPRVELRLLDDGGPTAFDPDQAAFKGRPLPGLYEGITLQIRNLIFDGLPVRTCQNKTCGNLFVRQQGRAEHEQNRTVGVMYCRHSCAKTEAQRTFRKKKRDAAEQSKREG
jgi:hypothetical protein